MDMYIYAYAYASIKFIKLTKGGIVFILNV
jgi:hypothetical protein